MSQRRPKPVAPAAPCTNIPQSSSMPPPMQGSQSTSTRVESNDIQQPTGDSPQADETESIPITGVVCELNSDGDEIVDTSGLKSKNWQHFQKVRLKGTGALKARCFYCKKKLVAEQKSGTTHLNDHYNSCLKRKMVDSKQKILTPSLIAGPGKKNILQPYSYDPEYARQQLAYMIIMHEYPLSIVEHLGFRRFCYAPQPMFQVVCRNTIKKDILKIYDVEKLKTMRLMENNRSRISLTTDMWTASNQKRGFMVITTHFIDDSWKLQSRILRFVYVPCPHTAETLCEVLMDTFLEWNIDRKLSTLTVDNCTTNDAMINFLLEKFGDDNVWCKSFFHVRCAAHILNLIVKDGLDVIKSSIEKVRDSVAFWTATPKREEQFEDAARQLGVFCGKKLSLDCPTRWNSTYLMLETAIQYKSAFSRLRLKNNQYKCCPSDDDWNLAIDICERLDVFYKVTLLFSGTSYPTSNLFFANVCEIKLKLSEWVDCENYVVAQMALNMIEKYDKYWDNIHGFLRVAAVLDPRFKMSLIECYYTDIYGVRGVEMVENVKTRCYDLLTVYEGKKDKNYGEASSNPPPFTSSMDSDLKRYALFLSSRKKGKTSHVKLELDHYLEEEVLPTCNNFDILAWWKSSGLRYPTLQAIARDVLAVPVSTVSSESSFSTGGRVVTPNRNRLHPKTLEALMCTQSWLAAHENGGEAMPGNPFPTINDDDMDTDECISNVTCVDD